MGETKPIEIELHLIEPANMSTPQEEPPDEEVRDSQWAHYQSWLRLHARLQIDKHFQGKFDESDIAQQTVIEAWRSQSNFRGSSERERLAWLRQILANVLGHEKRRYQGTQKRDLRREQSLEKSISQSSMMLGAIIPAEQTSPSQIVQQRESEALVAEALERLPADYREVIIQRNLQGKSHEEIAKSLGRTTAAARMLWIRALRQLKQEFDNND